MCLSEKNQNLADRLSKKRGKFGAILSSFKSHLNLIRQRRPH